MKASSAPTSNIEIRLFASLQAYAPPNAKDFVIFPGQTVRNVLTALGVPLEEVQLVFVNGTKKEMDTVLTGGERVGVFPPVGGG
jgi:molybdopterin converting factor small subunit